MGRTQTRGGSDRGRAQSRDRAARGWRVTDTATDMTPAGPETFPGLPTCGSGPTRPPTQQHGLWDTDTRDQLPMGPEREVTSPT